MSLIETQEDNLRNIQTRVVLCDDFLLRLLEWVLTNDWLDIREAAACKFRTGLCEGFEVFEWQENTAGMVECRGEELMVGAQEAYAIEWRACKIALGTGCRRGYRWVI